MPQSKIALESLLVFLYNIWDLPNTWNATWPQIPLQDCFAHQENNNFSWAGDNQHNSKSIPTRALHSMFWTKNNQAHASLW